MTRNRGQQPATVYVLSSEVDAYGQPRKEVIDTFPIFILIKKEGGSSLRIEDSPIYDKTLNIGVMTFDSRIDSSCEIECEGIRYGVIDAIPAGRNLELILRRLKDGRE